MYTPSSASLGTRRAGGTSAKRGSVATRSTSARSAGLRACAGTGRSASGLLDAGMSYAALVDAAVASSFFADLAGSHGNADFVRTVYRNVVGSTLSAADLAYFTGLLDS